MLRFNVSRSLVLFLLLVIAVGFAIGHGYTALGIAAFAFFLASIDAKPSWKRIWNPDPQREGGVLRFTTWKWPGAQRERGEHQQPKL